MTSPTKAPPGACGTPWGASPAEPGVSGLPHHVEGACGRCCGPIPVGASGRPRRGARYCSAGCRFAAVADRRATARGDLLQALAQLGDTAAAIDRALKSLGLRPSKPRTKKKEKS